MSNELFRALAPHQSPSGIAGQFGCDVLRSLDAHAKRCQQIISVKQAAASWATMFRTSLPSALEALHDNLLEAKRQVADIMEDNHALLPASSNIR